MRRDLARDDDLLRARLAATTAPVLLSVGRLDRQDAVEAGFRAAVDALARLVRDMAAVVARFERARVAGEYVVAEAT
ncbi:hypothetical protein CDD83_2060 [Cordyceps sp. RAO-2017]|nr:hypothetical protein CDD83_2060 [Cordyceps sp. RAO-2017]